jgi:mono/diheme cytochrome c family protein
MINVIVKLGVSMTKPQSWTIAILLAILTMSASINAQDDAGSVWDGVFTDEQATRGEITYEQECATCHLADLLGDGIAPALTGAAFDFRWSDLSVGDMFVAIRATMPQGAPASLSPQGYADIVSYLLKRNDLPAGNSELPTDEDTLSAIIIHGDPPAGSGQAEGTGTAQGGEPSVWDGVFTDEQATRGEIAYEQECATCHLADLLGDGIAPALTGAAFDFRWSDLSIGDMFASLRATMPQGAPASLSPQGYVDIISYLLTKNDFPAGDMELPPSDEVLNSIMIKSEQP